MQLTLSARQPFNFHSVVNSHGWLQLAPFRFDEKNEILFYMDRLENGRVIDYHMSAVPEGVAVEVKGKLNRFERNEVAGKVAWMFGLDQDFTHFYRVARGEPKLRKARRMAYGRVLRSPTFFEDVLKTILTTNTLWAATKRMNNNLIASFGDSVTATLSGGRSSARTEVEGDRTFPSPKRIAASSERYLRETVRVGYRAPGILELARRVHSGELDLESFKTSTLPTLELRKELMKINGIGPYAAANLLMILGRSDFIPIDSWALKLVSREWYRGKPVTPKQVERRFAKWGEFKGLAFWFWDWKYDGG